jgi:hypothetical protein
MDEADLKHSAKITNLNQEDSDLKIENGNLKSKVEKLEKAPPTTPSLVTYSANLNQLNLKQKF